MECTLSWFENCAKLGQVAGMPARAGMKGTQGDLNKLENRLTGTSQQSVKANAKPCTWERINP